jgi:hypothetical protein
VLTKTDLILDENPTNEYGNKVPEISTTKTDFPFVLKKDEAILHHENYPDVFIDNVKLVCLKG